MLHPRLVASVRKRSLSRRLIMTAAASLLGVQDVQSLGRELAVAVVMNDDGPSADGEKLPLIALSALSLTLFPARPPPCYTTNVPDVRFFSTHFVSRQPVIIIAPSPLLIPFVPQQSSPKYIYICTQLPVPFSYVYIYIYIYAHAFILSRVAFRIEGCSVAKVLPHTIIVMYILL